MTLVSGIFIVNRKFFLKKLQTIKKLETIQLYFICYRFYEIFHKRNFRLITNNFLKSNFFNNNIQNSRISKKKHLILCLAYNNNFIFFLRKCLMSLIRMILIFIIILICISFPKEISDNLITYLLISLLCNIL